MNSLELTILQYLRSRTSPDGDHMLFHRGIWAKEVDGGKTSLTYKDWLDGKISSEVRDAEFCVQSILACAIQAAYGDLTQEALALRVDTFFAGLRLSGDEAATAARLVLGRKESRDHHLPREDFGMIPSDLAFELSKLCILFLPDRFTNPDTAALDQEVVRIATTHGIDCPTVDLARKRLSSSP